MSTVSSALRWSWLIAACAACSGESETGPASQPPELDHLDRLRRLECVRNEHCRASNDPTLRRARNALIGGLMAIDEALLDECEASEDRVVFDVRDDEPTARTSPCVRLWTGLTANGEACDLDTACEAGHFCDRENDGRRSQVPDVAGACGVCRPQGVEGGACDVHMAAGDELECLDGLLCQDGTCISPPASPPGASYGEPCGSGISCMDGLRCGASPSTGFDALCGPPSGEGEPCLFDIACGPMLACTGNYYNVGECIPTVLDGSCDPTPGCANSLVCIPVEGIPYTYSCKPTAARGEACADSLQCPADHLCLESECRRLLAPGDPCGEPPDRCADGSECLDGICAYLPVTGEPCVSTCADASDCSGGVCTAPDLPDVSSCNGTSAFDECSAQDEYCRIGGGCEPLCYLGVVTESQ